MLHAVHPFTRRAGRFIIAALLLGAAFTASAAGFDHTHALFTKVLTNHVRNECVDYAALKTRPQDLNAYLDQLAAVKEADFDKWPEPQRLAFHLNLYNASVIRLILDHYPISSIKKIGGWFGSPWNQPAVRLFGATTTPGKLEHEILRVQFDEPRLHFALVCCARGCPPLRAEAFQAARLDAQLDEQGRLFLRTAHKNRVDVKTRTLHLSPIFKWFAEDFERGSGSVAKFVAPFFPDDVKRELAKGGFKTSYTDYDWLLNDVPAQK